MNQHAVQAERKINKSSNFQTQAYLFQQVILNYQNTNTLKMTKNARNTGWVPSAQFKEHSSFKPNKKTI